MQDALKSGNFSRFLLLRTGEIAGKPSDQRFKAADFLLVALVGLDDQPGKRLAPGFRFNQPLFERSAGLREMVFFDHQRIAAVAQQEVDQRESRQEKARRLNRRLVELDFGAQSLIGNELVGEIQLSIFRLLDVIEDP